MLYSATHQFVFVHVPKTGGSSVRVSLESANDAKRIVRWPHPSIADIKERQTGPWRSFGFVRNPFARAVSLFNSTPRGGDATQKGFLAFLQWNLYFFPPAWHYLAIDGALAVDLVGRFERLQEDFADICSWLGLGALSLSHVNRSLRTSPPLAELYADESRDLILRHHAADFEHFGYSEALF